MVISIKSATVGYYMLIVKTPELFMRAMATFFRIIMKILPWRQEFCQA